MRTFIVIGAALAAGCVQEDPLAEYLNQAVEVDQKNGPTVTGCLVSVNREGLKLTDPHNNRHSTFVPRDNVAGVVSKKPTASILFCDQ